MFWRLSRYALKVTISVLQKLSEFLTLKDNVTVTENKLRDTEKLMQKLYEKVDNLENRSRRDNIQVLGLKKGAEGSQPVAFFSSWLTKVLGLDITKGHIKVDCAHRSPSPQRGDRPRLVLIKAHNFSDKQHIMSAIKTKCFLEVDGQKVFIQQDLSSAVKEKCRSFNSSCEVLIQRSASLHNRGSNTYVSMSARSAGLSEWSDMTLW